MLTICLVPLIGVLAFVLDGGLLVAQRRYAQSVADASAHAAATSLYSNYTTNAGLDPQGKAAALAFTIASANGYTNDGVTNTVKVNIPPLSGSFVGQSGYAQVSVTYYQQRIFSAIFGSGVLPVFAQTVARGIPASNSSASVILLNPTASQSLSVSGSGSLTTTGSIDVDSNNSTAAYVSGGGVVKAPTINVVGTAVNSYGTLSGTVNDNASSVGDPYATLAAPTTSGLTLQPGLPGYGSYTMSPGIYSGGVSIGGGMTVTMSPGTYYMSGGGFSVSNGATLNGSGVFIYLDNSGGAISIGGGANVTLSPPTSGTYSGLNFYQNRSNSSAVSLSNGGTANIGGTIYAPAAEGVFAGGGSYTFGSQLIYNTMNISNGTPVTVNTSGGGASRKRQMNIVQ